MYILFYSLYRLIYCWRHHIKFTEQEDPWLSFKYYRKSKANNKKSLWRVLRDTDRLIRYWHRFPDTYFIFCHWLKEYNDWDKLYSFLPQRIYELALKGGVEITPYKILINDKILCHELLTHYGIPVPKMLLVYRNNTFFIENRIVKDEEVDKMLGETIDERLFVKLSTEGAARGVFIMKRTFEGYMLDGNKVSASLFRQRFIGKSMFIEPSLKQESFLHTFNPDTVNTVRVLTLNDINGNIKIISAAVRFGRKGGFVDNMHAGGLAVSINLNTGCMESYGARRHEPTKYYEHPDSHIKFEGCKVPQWDEIRSLVIRTLTYLPPYRSVGFDIVTTENGPLVLEINTGAGMDLAQVGKEKGIADAFSKYAKHY